MRAASAANSRLPSEAEWEYSARAGTLAPYSRGAGISDQQANFGGSRSQPIRSYPANAFGLFDTPGNVLEWVQDCYSPTYAGLALDRSSNDARCSDRVARGGSWYYVAAGLRSAFRRKYDPSYQVRDLGFRVARSLD